MRVKPDTLHKHARDPYMGLMEIGTVITKDFD
jgi:hypothetical protein